MRATAGTRLLCQKKVAFEAREYELQVKGAEAARDLRDAQVTDLATDQIGG